MSYWQKIKTKLIIPRRIPNKFYFMAGVLLVMSLYLVAFRGQTLAYNYSGDTCDRRLILLPGVFSQAGGKGYVVTTQGGWNVAGQQLTATAVCVSPTAAPIEDTSEVVAFAPWGSWVARFSYTVEAQQHPEVMMSALEQPIPASRDLLLPMSQPDTTFSYVLAANQKQAPCDAAEEQLACDVPALQLKQGSVYQATLEKRFKGETIEEIVSADLETLSPLSITESSIKNDATVYDKPTTVVLATDKPVKDATIAVWRTDTEVPEEIEASTEFGDSEVRVVFSQDLPRQATIELRVVILESDDGSTPLDETILAFKTSGGPKVTGVNAGASGVAAGASIVVTFDQEVSADQDLGELVAVGGGLALQARQGDRLVFSTADAARCAPISIVLKADISSPYGISGQSTWSYSGRMSCYTVATIGYSVQGRAITAYQFGTSGPVTLYTGAIHGDEFGTNSLMHRWIQELDANPGKIPAGKRVIVVPAINPDGLASGRRVNARNVDLNRNFAVGDWQKDIQHTNGAPFAGGGGESPMSEPESKAIAAFVAQQRPALVVSYHSIGSLAIPNQVGQSGTRAAQYASLSGYRLSGGGGGEFGYQITGTADDYYGEVLGIASILIELGSHSYHQFERNQTAMWAMLQ